MEGEEFLREKEREWSSDRSLMFATDLVSAATVLGGSEIASKAAEFILEHGNASSTLARRLAASLLGIVDPIEPPILAADFFDQTRRQISQLKRRRTSEPRNAFVWTDLARLYVLLGLNEQARAPIAIALALAPFDRFVVRSATRFYLHSGDPENALHLLRKTERARIDPWLISAELAVSAVAGRDPRFTKQAEDILRRKAESPFHTSEMTAALASLEMWSGNTRRAKRLFLQAVIHPSENALAQTVWAAREVGLTVIAAELLNIPNAFEAQTLAARNKAEWKSAVDHAKRWATDESFSVRPHAFASAIVTSILNNPQEGESLARAGLLTNPRHPGLINNIAFALVGQGKPNEAKRELEQINVKNADAQTQICIFATQGLIEYRLGKPIAGKQLYENSISLAHKEGNRSLKAIAQLYLAREEALIDKQSYLKLLSTAIHEIKKADSPHATALVAVIHNEILNHQIMKAANVKQQ